jgi:hypothetical protein
VDDPDLALGHPRGQRVVGRVEGGEVLHRRGVRLAVPALELALHEVAGPGEVVEAHRGRLDAVQGGEHVDRRGADVRPRRFGDLGAGVGVVEDLAGREVHDVQLGVPDVAVVAERARGGYGHVGRVQRGEEAPLAAHVVGGLEHPAQRGAAQRPGVPAVVGHPVGQVGAPTRDPGELEVALDLVDVRPEPARDRVRDLLRGHAAPPARGPIWASGSHRTVHVMPAACRATDHRAALGAGPDRV